MYYVVQNNVFREHNYNNLIRALDRLDLEYEIVKVLPFIETFDVMTNRTDVFPFGSLKMARLSAKLGWYPGSQMNENHDYLVYRDYYKENLLNWDSKIIKLGDDFFSVDPFFARPTKDTKVFTGKVFDMGTWEIMKNENLDYDMSPIFGRDTEIQISTVKRIQKEIRFWIVKGEVVTASQYRLGGFVQYDENVDQDAYDFCKKMVDIFQLNEAFVMDLAMVNEEYKIVECGCMNCAGFYSANMQKLLIKLEYAFS
jgi:hypothetical protein